MGIQLLPGKYLFRQNKFLKRSKKKMMEYVLIRLLYSELVDIIQRYSPLNEKKKQVKKMVLHIVNTYYIMELSCTINDCLNINKPISKVYYTNVWVKML